ncbi:acyl-CoA thioesterase [Larsenimonas rhizosphaerae]|uniref:Acyl-CoA thioesterase II n=1 Tax=Larsenimonas rhizosphaerae TaxID=2944682 RepID=A0AA42CT46_9GAMM|nr:acyl-CoA thioesterase II [Larsenimonas rhizosphaerae]MCM2130097.1 acyl-CoA thioesterase II [Larsenimonas rhizosphaerae]MCX2522784.1 acyl-CoA thioesterase II [Larsenimonas rhizosphaerae]
MPLKTLAELVQPDLLDTRHFCGQSQDLGLPQLYGGQVLGQALSAAQRTVEEGRLAHSLHGYFIAPGDPNAPVDYEVDILRDGGSFSTRRVTATQADTTLFISSASFHRPESGLEHQAPADLPPFPEALMAQGTRVERYPGHPIEFVRIAPSEQDPQHVRHWCRLSGELDAPADLHQVLLAYSSDFYLIASALRPHQRDFRDPNLRIASLDHAIWFHEHADITDWLLYDITAVWSGHGRALCRGVFYNQQGVRIASVAQEGLIRLKKG